MTERSVTHSTFVIERTYDASAARVFAAWSSQGEKSRWFGNDDSAVSDYLLEFKIGGHEKFTGPAPDGTIYSYDALYQDIVPDQRIVYTYEMYMGDQRISV